MKFKIIDIWETKGDPPQIMMAYKKQMCAHSNEEIHQIHYFDDYESLRIWLAMAGEADQEQEQVAMSIQSAPNCPGDLRAFVGKECDLTEFCHHYGERLNQARKRWREEEEEVRRGWEEMQRELHEADLLIQEQDCLMRELEADMRQAGGRQELLKHPVHLKSLRGVSDRAALITAEAQDRLRERGLIQG